MNREQIDILGIKIDKLSLEKILSEISSVLDSPNKLFIITANPEGVILAQKDTEFKEAIGNADIVTADGIGLLWAAKLLDYKTSKTFFRFVEIPFLALFSLLSLIFYPPYVKQVLLERVTGADLFWEIIRRAYKNDKSVYLLGGYEEVAGKVREKLEKKFKGIRIAGAYPGTPQEKDLVEKINKSGADVLFVAWGQPKQEKWIRKNLKDLDVKLVIGVGGTFDVVAGKVKRAPRFFQKIGLEWLWRLFMEPGKRIKRIFIAIPKFIFEIIRYKIKSKR